MARLRANTLKRQKSGALFSLWGLIVLLMATSSPAQNNNEKVIHVFEGIFSPGGASPWDGVVVDSAGNVYGGAVYGGLYNNGIIFQMSPNVNGTWTETAAHNFDDSDYNDGAGPVGGLVFDKTGNLYGTTIGGGSYNAGVAFELSPQGHGRWGEKILHDFGGYLDGTDPRSTLIIDPNGNLYGTTSEGGANGQGIVFELSRNSVGEWEETILYNFTAGDGSGSTQPMALDASGNLWGTMVSGGAYGFGEIFELSPSSAGYWTETVIHSFAGGSDGAYPNGGFIIDARGNLYGTTSIDGPGGVGYVFELSSVAGAWVMTILHNLDGSDGFSPIGNLSFGPAGTLYGVTWQGGSYGQGNVYALKPSSDGTWTERDLHSFRGNQQGCQPDAGVVQDSAGNLYGTTLYCGNGQGAYGSGVVFEIVLTR